MLHLFVSMFWLIVGAALLSAHFGGQKVPYINHDGSLMLGLLALLFALYSFVRWWAARATARTKSRLEETRRNRFDGPPVDYDPTFDFTRPDSPEPPK